MNVAYVADERYIRLVEHSARTLLQHNPEASVCVVSASPLATALRNVVIDTSGVEFRFKPGDRLTPAAYLKFFLPRLAEILDWARCIYLDGDTMIRGSLADLWLSDLRTGIGLCHGHDYAVRQAADLGLPLYGCTGVMLLDLLRLNLLDFELESLRAMREIPAPPSGWFHDETTINVRWRNELTFLPLKWDFCVNRSYSRYSDAIDPSDAVIWHYIGAKNKRLMLAS